MRENWGDKYDEYHQKIVAAINDTNDEVMKYEGKYITAMFFLQVMAILKMQKIILIRVLCLICEVLTVIGIYRLIQLIVGQKLLLNKN